MSASMLVRVEHVGVVFDAQAQFAARRGLHRQRVVGGFAAGELGDGQPVGARQRGGVDRVVLVDEKGVEQLVVAGDAVDLAKRQVLVVECVGCGRFAVGRAGRRWWWPA